METSQQKNEQDSEACCWYVLCRPRKRNTRDRTRGNNAASNNFKSIFVSFDLPELNCAALAMKLLLTLLYNSSISDPLIVIQQVLVRMFRYD